VAIQKLFLERPLVLILPPDLLSTTQIPPSSRPYQMRRNCSKARRKQQPGRVVHLPQKDTVFLICEHMPMFLSIGFSFFPDGNMVILFSSSPTHLLNLTINLYDKRPATNFLQVIFSFSPCLIPHLHIFLTFFPMYSPPPCTSRPLLSSEGNFSYTLGNNSHIV